MRSPMSFFDKTPIGQILNRFSTDLQIRNRFSMDLQVVDVQLRTTTQQLFLCIFNIAVGVLIGILVVVLTATPYVGLAIVPLAFFYFQYANLYRHSSREVQRLDSVSKSPIYAGFAETLNGVTTIRAFEASAGF
ncbi:ABC transporter type 1, transmembrane domain-containing protein, partial [Pavlovales sp. CCMP2436]